MPQRIRRVPDGLVAVAATVLAIVAVLMLGAAVSARAAGLTGPPRNESPPSISGSPGEGAKVKAGKGTWTGAKGLEYAYQWSLCDGTGGGCEAIAGASKPAYKPVSADVGHRLRVTVTARNPEGSASATSGASAPVASAAPKKKGRPSITGAAVDGRLLTVGNGIWKGTPPFTYTYQWEACTGRACSPLPGATGTAYRPTTSELGQTLRATVTAKNGAGSAREVSRPTEKVIAGPPIEVEPPDVSGTPLPGQTLTATSGSWAGTTPLAIAYQWRSCNLADQCTDIAGANSAAYTVGALDVANSLEVVVTASNSLGSASATSSQTGLIKELLPVNRLLPSITGLLQDGGHLLAALGEWASNQALDFSYQWQVCNSAGEACKDVAGALDSPLALLSGFVGDTVRVLVTASNSAGSTTAISEPTSLVKALLPSNIGLPSIAGLLQDGALLSALAGKWSGTEPSYSYQWQLCDGAGEGCKDVAGALAPTLSLLSGFVGDTVRVLVTATNSAGSTTAASEPTSLVKALLPSNIVLPSITGLLEDGGLLSALAGKWSGTEPSYSYQWQLCDGAGEGCKDVAGALGTSLGLLAGEVGKTLRVVVTATNSAGSTTATSGPTSVVKALLPSNTGLPSIVGSLVDGQLLNAVVGKWSGTEPSYSYQWQLCNGAGEGCKDVAGALAPTLSLLSGFVGDTVRVVVTASNSAGSTSAASQPTSLIKALLPSNVSLPAIGGTPEDGKTLTGATGSWSGTAPITYSYQWQQCNGTGGECKPVSAGETLSLFSGLVKSTLRLAVTATNSGGSTQAVSAPTSPVLAALPLNQILPTISGLLKLGSELLAHHETWTGTSPITYTYQWQLCGVLGLVVECSNIPGATKEHILLELLDLGLTMRVGVTAHNERGGSETAYSKVTGLIAGLGLSPMNGSQSGGTEVTLTGAGVGQATAVRFGAQKATEVEVVAPDEVTAVAPPGSGTVGVTVSTPEGTTAESEEAQFTYR